MGRRFYADTPPEQVDILGRVLSYLIGLSARYDAYQSDWCWEMARCLEEMMVEIADENDVYVDPATLYFEHGEESKNA